MTNKKTSSLVLIGLAAFAYYKYTKMSPEDRDSLTNTIKEKGKSLLEQFLPAGLKTAMGGTTTADKNYEAGSGM